MKANIITLTLSALFLIVGCSNGDKGGQEPIPDPAPNSEVKAIKFNIDRDYVRLWCGTNYTVGIVSDGVFTIESLNPDVATVELQDDQFVIRSKALGEADIIIKDANDSERQSILRCYSRAFAGRWGEHVDLSKFYKNEVVICADDRSLADDITKELLSRTVYRYGATYDFSDDSDKVIVTLQTSAPGTKFEGTYNWDMKTGVFTLSYNNHIEHYWVDIQPPLQNSTAPPFIVALHEDYTEEFSSKYPDDGIKQVTLIRYIVSYGDCWWANSNEGHTEEGAIIL